MNKTELISKVVEVLANNEVKVTKKAMSEYVDTIFNVIADSVAAGDTVSSDDNIIWFSSNISDTFVFDVNTVISWLFENFIFTLFNFTFPAITDIPNIIIKIILIAITFL